MINEKSIHRNTIFYTKMVSTWNYLIQVFSKDEKANLSDAEKNAVKQVISVLKKEAAENWRKEHE